MSQSSDTPSEEYAATIAFPLACTACSLVAMAIGTAGSSPRPGSMDLDLAYLPVMAAGAWLVHLVSVLLSRTLIRRISVVATLASSSVAGVLSIAALTLSVAGLNALYGIAASPPTALVLGLVLCECFLFTATTRFVASRISTKWHRTLPEPKS